MRACEQLTGSDGLYTVNLLITRKHDVHNSQLKTFTKT